MGTVTGRFGSSKLELVRIGGGRLCSLPSVVSEVSNGPLGFVVFVSSLDFAGGSRSFNTLGTVLRNDMGNETGGVTVCTASGHHRLIGRDFTSHSKSSIRVRSAVRRLADLSTEFNLRVAFSEPSGGLCSNVIIRLTGGCNVSVPRSGLVVGTRTRTLETNNEDPEATERFVRCLTCGRSTRGRWTIVGLFMWVRCGGVKRRGKSRGGVQLKGPHHCRRGREKQPHRHVFL